MKNGAYQRVDHEKDQKKRKKWTLKILLAAGLVLAIVIVLLCGKSPLKGKWDLDGVTSYVFYNNGKGALVLPTAEYEFRYTIEEDVLVIDYTDEQVKDARYTYSIDGNKLTLNGGNATTQGEFVYVKTRK